MASKQLGKLRQWAGEVISSKDKTSLSAEFKELERDIELRRLGNVKLHITSTDYHHALVKKKDSEALIEEKDRLLPVDSFGIVMIQHGEEFGDESAYGTSLVSLGKAHCKMATLQETFAMAFEDTFLASVIRTAEDIKEYQKERKKLDSRRLSYDAAIAKLEKVKGSKKEKERLEAEDEFERAKERYEESEADVYDRMVSIQQNEVVQLKDLTALLDLEINVTQQQLNVLHEVRETWVDEETIAQLESTVNIYSAPPPPPPVISSYTPTSEDLKRTLKKPSSRANSTVGNSSDTSPDDGDIKRTDSLRSRARSFTRRKSDAAKPASRGPSRPQSRAEDRKKRTRTDSNATATSLGEKDRHKGSEDEDGEKEKKEKTSKRLSMAGWASSKVSSIGIGRGKKEGGKERDREKFSALMENQDDVSSDEDGQRSKGGDSSRSSPTKRPRSKSISKSKSGSTTPNASPRINTRILRHQSSSQPNSPRSSPVIIHPPSGKRKLVEAVHDFTASKSDELSFKAGDTILVTNEVVDGWWMGELQNGSAKKGMFPTSYTRTVPQASTSSSSSSLSMLTPGLTRRKSKSTPDKPHKELLLHPSDEDSVYEVSPMDFTPQVIRHEDSIGYNGPAPVSDSEDEQHPFGDHNEAPHVITPSFTTPIRSNSYDAASIDSSELDHFDDEHDNLMPSSMDSLDRLEINPSRPSSGRTSSNVVVSTSSSGPPLPTRRFTESASSGPSTPLMTVSSLLPAKKAPPPPPPPRRIQSTSAPNTPPVLPPRPGAGAIRTNSSQSISSGASSNSFAAVAQSTTPILASAGPMHLEAKKGSEELTYSPFDSPTESSFVVGCRDFKQNPFKPRGFCSNCFQTHG